MGFTRFLRLFLSSLLGLACSAEETGRVIILANKKDTASVEVARYYAQKRSIPLENIIHLETSLEETISIEEYVRTIHNPLLEKLAEADWINGVKAASTDSVGRERFSVAVHRIAYLVPVYGIPLRIANNPELLEAQSAQLPEPLRFNRASVDGELALLAGASNLPMVALVRNPLFEQKTPRGVDAERVIRVTRLDGPSSAMVMRLIDRSLEAEERGLMGRAYFDVGGGPHAAGNEWLNAAGDLAQAAFFDTDFETTRRLMDFRDRFDAPAIYMGWYRHRPYGPWRAPRWEVPPGAIAFHLHSFSGTSVRKPSEAWLAAFVQQGYCAMVGNVYEPYLEFTHRPQLLLSALLEGRTFGDAAMYSNPGLSWMGVAIGDPLYRPFKKDLDEQLSAPAEGLYRSHLYVRQINRLKAEAGLAEAVAFARKKFVQHPSLVLAHSLAALYEETGAPEKAVEVLKIIRYISTFSLEEILLVAQIADRLDRNGEGAMALDIYRKLIETPGLDKELRIRLFEGGAAVAGGQNASTLVSRWSLEARQLREPPVPSTASERK